MDSWKNDSFNGTIGYIGDSLTTESNLTRSSMTWRGTTTVFAYVRAAIYWMIFVVGIPGNLLVVAGVIWKLVKSPQHQAMTIFVGSLAVSDLGLLSWVTWTNALLSISSEWIFGKVACHMYVLWRSMTADCSIMTLMFISADR